MLVLKPTSRLALADDIMLQGIPELDHYYAFDTTTGDHYQLNRTAHWVLESIGKGISFQELLDMFAKTFELSKETAGNDLLEVIHNSLENHIIKEVSQ